MPRNPISAVCDFASPRQKIPLLPLHHIQQQPAPLRRQGQQQCLHMLAHPPPIWNRLMTCPPAGTHPPAHSQHARQASERDADRPIPVGRSGFSRPIPNRQHYPQQCAHHPKTRRPLGRRLVSGRGVGGSAGGGGA